MNEAATVKVSPAGAVLRAGVHERRLERRPLVRGAAAAEGPADAGYARLCGIHDRGGPGVGGSDPDRARQAARHQREAQAAPIRPVVLYGPAILLFICA